jgi:hypothetical protein
MWLGGRLKMALKGGKAALGEGEEGEEEGSGHGWKEDGGEEQGFLGKKKTWHLYTSQFLFVGSEGNTCRPLSGDTSAT